MPVESPCACSTRRLLCAASWVKASGALLVANSTPGDQFRCAWALPRPAFDRLPAAQAVSALHRVVEMDGYLVLVGQRTATPPWAYSVLLSTGHPW